jgi:hypothetical protein
MKIFITALMLLGIASLVACTKGGKPEGVNGALYTVTSAASSRQLVPAIDTTSTGTFSGLYDEQTNILTYTITWDDLWRTSGKDTITSISFYGPASATSNGNIVRSLPFTSTNNAGSINLGLSGNTGFTSNEKKDFLSGVYYYTINTKKFPTGIVRGQLTAIKK